MRLDVVVAVVVASTALAKQTGVGLTTNFGQMPSRMRSEP
jgi:hypothetical protein